MESSLTMILPSDLSFDEWIHHIFVHDDNPDMPWWFWGVDADYWQAPPSQVIAMLTKLFENPFPVLSDYRDEQVNRGLWYIVSNGGSDYMFALLDETVPLVERLRCISSFYTLFEKLYAVRCSAHLSHLDEPGSNPLNMVCYMWWDLLPIAGSIDQHDGEAMNAAFLDVMARALALDSTACQEAALHGLGHWASTHPVRVRTIIEAFLAQNRSLRQELRQYAETALSGCVL
jgi:hypothetical protein